MKTPFTLDAWLADKSQKVETRDGRTARIICTDAKADDGACIIALIPGYGGEEAYQFFPNGHAFSSKSSDEDCTDLFIVTPEPEMSEFEMAIKDLVLDIDEGELQKLGVFEEENLGAWAIKKASELLSLAKSQLLQSGELLTQEHHEKLMETLREECKKDLPRWKIWRNGACGNSEGHPIALVQGAGGIRFVSCLGANGEKYIMLSDIEKLPGFKEEDHE